MEFHPGKAGFLSLLLVAALSRQSLEKSLPSAEREQEDSRESPGLIRCGEYSNQVLPNGRCRIVATLPQGDERRCPDLFRCTDEVSFWLHENEERKQQILELRELISELQEELRNHRHRIKALESQVEGGGFPWGFPWVFPAPGIWQGQGSDQEHSRENFFSSKSLMSSTVGRVLDPSHSQSPGDPAESVFSLWDFTALGIRKGWDLPFPEIKHGRNCPIDCASVYSNGLRRSGIYSILPSVRGVPIEVLCEMDTEGGGWTVIQRRQDGSVDFNRTWNEYKEGFGDLHGEFWLGNDNIHRMTSQGDYSLRIDLEDWNNKHKHAFYQVFRVGIRGSPERSVIIPKFSDFRGVVFPRDPIPKILPRFPPFSASQGGRYSIKNRRMLGPDGIVWYSWKDTDYYSLRKVVMMIRPRSFRPRLSP
ncbi:angiopoietin-4-like [Parus major]|nr:angiopoietin-4-like [Parus major]